MRFNALAMGRIGCQQCHGCGTTSRGLTCRCTERRQVLGTWERLWLESRLKPELFPPHPVPTCPLGAMWQEAGR